MTPRPQAPLPRPPGPRRKPTPVTIPSPRRAPSGGSEIPDGRPKILDMYCCQGGASAGYVLAGFDAYGVDILPRGGYPFAFHQGDVFDVLGALTAGQPVDFTHPDGRVDRLTVEDFAAAHGSPPCQGEGGPAKGNQKELADKYPHLIAPTRKAFDALGLPYVIENVNGSDVRRDVTLCGDHFGLGVIMHRHFELGGGWSTPPVGHPPRHRGYVRGWRHGVWRDGPYVAAYGKGGGKATVAEMRAAKHIDWIDDHLALREALPPDYTRFLGERLLSHLTGDTPTNRG